MRFCLLLLLPWLATTIIGAELDYASLSQRPMLGVHMSPPSPETQVANGTLPTVGVEVLSIYSGTTAEAVGVEIGDVIIGINGGEIGLMSDVRNEVALAGIGAKVEVDVLRSGKALTLTGTLAKWPEHVPHDPLDDAAEQQFRAWQAERFERITATVDEYEHRLNALEQRSAQNALREQAPQDQNKPPPFAVRIRARFHHDSNDRHRTVKDRAVSWEARVLFGVPQAPIIY